MPMSPYRPPDLQWQVFRGSEAVSAGLLSPNQLRSLAWRRELRDVYCDSRLDPDHSVSCHAAALLMPLSAALSGPSAAWLLGIESAVSVGDPVHVTVPPDVSFGPVRGLAVHACELPSADVEADGVLRRTTPTRTAWDVAAWLTPPRAVAILDPMLASGLVSDEQLARMVDERTGVRGWRRTATAFGLTDPAAQSPPESMIRVRLVLAGLPRPVCQHPVRTRAGVVVHPDLAWPEHRVALEYDGQYHAEPDRLEHDRRRLNLLVAEGWTVLHATARSLGRDFGALRRQVELALHANGWRPGPAAVSGKLGPQARPNPTTSRKL